MKIAGKFEVLLPEAPRAGRAVVKFSEFKSKKSGLPVEWQVLEATPESGREALTKMRESGVECHYEYGKHPKLMDWTMDNRESAYEGVVSVAS